MKTFSRTSLHICRTSLLFCLFFVINISSQPQAQDPAGEKLFLGHKDFPAQIKNSLPDVAGFGVSFTNNVLEQISLLHRLRFVPENFLTDSGRENIF